MIECLALSSSISISPSPALPSLLGLGVAIMRRLGTAADRWQQLLLLLQTVMDSCHHH
jgi:hypothetical protein